MPDRICQVADCGEVIPQRRGNPAKRCPGHINSGICEACGTPTSRAPGVTRGPLPRFCNAACRYEVLKTRRTPAQLEEHRRRSRESCRFDMFCKDCGVLIPRRADSIRRDTRCSSCKPLHRSQQVARKDRAKKFRQYGITPEQYDEMLAAQGGRCAFCGTDRPHPRLEHEFYVDHDHACCPGKGRSCGKCVRFLLCIHCNAGIGYFRDDPAVLRAAADALDRHQASQRTLRVVH